MQTHIVNRSVVLYAIFDAFLFIRFCCWSFKKLKKIRRKNTKLMEKTENGLSL